MTTVYLGSRSVRLTPGQVIGKGGEADIYDLGNRQALKVYKRPDNPDYVADPQAQSSASQRLAEQQQKLPAFPGNLPPQVVAPQQLAYEKKQQGQIVGYSMEHLEEAEVLLSYGDRRYRELGGIDGNQVVDIFRNLHETVRAIHNARVVIGDFNDLNVLVDSAFNAYLVDADSMQFGSFLCRTFTARFLDPLKSRPDQLVMAYPHDENSDWYAFAVMLFQSLLYVSPYGGVHRSKTGSRLQHDARVLKRISVFDSEVVYPKPALPLDILPDELLDYFCEVYHKDKRQKFPLELLSLRWTVCNGCGLAHARGVCPDCARPGALKQTTNVRGQVTATRLFRTHGRLLHAAFQQGKVRYLYHEDGMYRREDGAAVVNGPLDPKLRFRISGDVTLIGKKERLLVFESGKQLRQLTTDSFGNLPVFDANQRHYFWLQNGQLMRDGKLGDEYIGDILTKRTLVWSGSRFGFGFYQAGRLMRAFVFDTEGRGLNDSVEISTLTGQLIDATCVFSERLAWFMVSLQEGGRLINRCFVVDERGNVIATASAYQDEDSWLAAGIRGRFAVDKALFAATDQGVVRIGIGQGGVHVDQLYPDTSVFVTSATKLLPGPEGILAVSDSEIVLLKLG